MRRRQRRHDRARRRGRQGRHEPDRGPRRGRRGRSGSLDRPDGQLRGERADQDPAVLPVSPALAQATPELTRYPSAAVKTGAASDTVYSIAGTGISGSTPYVEVYTVVYVCGSGIADDCDHSVGTPEYRIPLAPNATFHILDSTMRPDKTTDFAGFRTYAAGPDGKYDGSSALFQITLDDKDRATGFTAVYTA